MSADTTATIATNIAKGDAVVMAWFAGAKAASDFHTWKDNAPRLNGCQPKVIMGRQPLSARGRSR